MNEMTPSNILAGLGVAITAAVFIALIQNGININTISFQLIAIVCLQFAHYLKGTL